MSWMDITMDAFDLTRIRRFYDRFGAWQDSQGFYENAVQEKLIRNSDFPHARSVLEVGCGTGKFAARLLAEALPDDARYVGIDLSSTMVDLSRKRISPWADRAEIVQSDGGFDFTSYGPPLDRIIFIYVLEILSEMQIQKALAGAHAALTPGGLLCAAVLTEGIDTLSRLTTSVWSALHNMQPYLVGGCRPLVLRDHIPEKSWQIRHRDVIVSMSVPSEIIVAEAI